MSTLQINNKAKQQTQLLPSRHAASRPSLRGSLLRPLPSSRRVAQVTIAFVFLLGTAYFLHPFTFDSASAETATGTASAEMSVNLDPTITIWTTDTNNNNIDSINIAADPDESVYTGAGRVHVSTNNLTGYTLTIQSNSTDAKMKHENTSITKTIDPLTSSGTSSSSWAGNSTLNNRWGYRLGTNDSFVGVPGSSSSATTIDSTDAPNNDNYTDITFATKADLSLPAGTYTDTVIFSAVANALPNPTLQNFTAADCAALPTWSSSTDDLTLTDSRDNNLYVIRRLADGNCWMAQNLRLVGPRTLTSSDSDITSGSFALPASTTWTDTNVTGKHLVAAADAPIGSSSGSKADSDLAYARGTYYTWPTAVANTSSIGASSVQFNSICPKGWDLPAGDGTLSFSSLARFYPRNYSGLMNAFDYYYHNADTTTKNYHYAGFWNNSDNHIDGSGEDGSWWLNASNPSYDDIARYIFYDTTGWTDQNEDGDRSYGFNVRCVLSSE